MTLPIRTSLDWIRFNSSDPVYHVLDLRASFTPIDPLEAAVQTVYSIVSKYPAPYTLMVSGGVDSQAMLIAWVKSGIEFKARAVRYTENLNDYDLLAVELLAERLGVELEFADFDVLDFLETEYSAWALQYDCSSPQICTHMKMCSAIGGTTIFSGNFSEKKKAFINYTTMGLDRFRAHSGISIVPFFFLENPALTFAFIPILDTLDRFEGYRRKCEAYTRAGFPIIRQSKKMTGFEKIKDYYDDKYSETVQTRLRFANKPSKRIFDLRLRYPYEEQLNNPHFSFITNWTREEVTK